MTTRETFTTTDGGVSRTTTVTTFEDGDRVFVSDTGVCFSVVDGRVVFTDFSRH